jgi:hypothetical protein
MAIKPEEIRPDGFVEKRNAPTSQPLEASRGAPQGQEVTLAQGVETAAGNVIREGSSAGSVSEAQAVLAQKERSESGGNNEASSLSNTQVGIANAEALFTEYGIEGKDLMGKDQSADGAAQLVENLLNGLEKKD